MVDIIDLKHVETKRKLEIALGISGVSPESFDILTEKFLFASQERVGEIFPVYLVVSKANGMILPFAVTTIDKIQLEKYNE